MAKAAYIAFADDDSDDQEMLVKRFLKYHPDTQFQLFKDGQELTHYLEACPDSDLPAVVLLDYKMPIVTGADVLRILQAGKRYDAVRKVVWSTSGNNQYVSECMRNGAEKYFAKPNDVRELDEIITQIAALFYAGEASRQS
jgi:DNA-binding NarL/FixJ family response regulator